MNCSFFPGDPLGVSHNSHRTDENSEDQDAEKTNIAAKAAPIMTRRIRSMCLCRFRRQRRDFAPLRSTKSVSSHSPKILIYIDSRCLFK
jgi:hypothetical protein